MRADEALERRKRHLLQEPGVLAERCEQLARVLGPPATPDVPEGAPEPRL